MITAKDILDYLESESMVFQFRGDLQVLVEGFSSAANYKENTVTWFKTSQVKGNNKKEPIALVVLQEGCEAEAKAVIEAQNSKAIFFHIIEHFFAEGKPEMAIGKGTIIGSDVKLGENVVIGNNCSIEGNIEIGEGTHIADNVVIRNRVRIGRYCNIQSLTVIGEDGFGYSEDGSHKKTMIRHYGGVIIGDEVFIGSHVNIARGTIDDTVIGNGVKIAPTTHIGHNNVIGNDVTIICSQLFGSVHVEDNAYITSSVIRNQCRIGEDAVVGMGSVVTKNVEQKKTVIGVPAKEMQKK